MSYLDRLKDHFPENCPTEVLTKPTEATLSVLSVPRVGQNKASAPLSPSSEGRRQKVFRVEPRGAMTADIPERDGDRYAVPVTTETTSASTSKSGSPSLEYDAGLPRPEAELAAARITAIYARNPALPVGIPTGGPLAIPRLRPLRCPTSPVDALPLTRRAKGQARAAAGDVQRSTPRHDHQRGSTMSDSPPRSSWKVEGTDDDSPEPKP
jgi:hypothetical protein